MALQDNLNQVKTQAQAYVKQLQAQAKDLQAIVLKAADQGSAIVKNGAGQLSNEADSVKGGYASVIEQLKVFGDVRNVDGLKTAVKGRIEWLPKASSAVEAEAKKLAGVVSKTGNELGDVVKSAYAEATGSKAKPAKKKAAPKKAAAKKPAAKKVTAKAAAAKKTVAKKAAPAKKTVAKKATAAKITTANKTTAAKKTVAKKAA